ncbi:PREDICTED: uncharacterized protein LOC104822136 [Tarenaya hassleriana]|uniref:uncharacterized protein LOC104822136 n=1 Tax=Tarenaya hassleriana TaxID=28532 RepID=UPI00053C2483|nr:PREDICTED: uncharacterized protein LOC104822136 [Tarenaya hassleriana]
MATKFQEKLEFLDILKQSARLLRCNTSLLIWVFFSSVPLFSFLIFFELSLQNTLYHASLYLSRHQRYSSWSYYYYSYGKSMPGSGGAVVWPMFQTCLLYLFPYQFLNLFTTTTVVAASSAVYTSDEPMGLPILARRSVEICRNRLRGCLITSLYVLLFSTSVLFGFIFTATNYYYWAFLFGQYDYSYVLIDLHGEESYHYNWPYGQGDLTKLLLHISVVLLHGAAFVVLSAKLSKWSAGWNMGLVVSVLEVGSEEEAVYGSDALSLSACYGRGHERQGLWLMLVFFVNALVLRLPCFYSDCSASRTGVYYTCAYAGLICAGNAFKWVACVLFYHESRTRALKKKADLEVGAKGYTESS